jgi:NADPH:quinone reductase
MRAVLCSAFTGPEELRIGEIDEPVPASDEILIDVHAASVSFMDHLLVSGLYQMRPSTPFVPGTEAAGVVIAVGAKVTRFQPGDRVACGNWTGGYAERMVAKESKSVRLPVGVAKRRLRSGTTTARRIIPWSRAHERKRVKRCCHWGRRRGRPRRR